MDAVTISSLLICACIRRLNLSLCMPYIDVAFQFHTKHIPFARHSDTRIAFMGQWQCKYLLTFFLLLLFWNEREKCKTVLRFEHEAYSNACHTIMRSSCLHCCCCGINITDHKCCTFPKINKNNEFICRRYQICMEILIVCFFCCLVVSEMIILEKFFRNLFFYIEIFHRFQIDWKNKHKNKRAWITWQRARSRKMSASWAGTSASLALHTELANIQLMSGK